MIDLGTYVFKDSNTGKITQEESVTNVYVEEVYGSQNVRTATKKLRVILNAKYEKADLHKVMEKKCQNLAMTQRNELLQYFLKSCLMEHLASENISSRLWDRIGC